MKRCSLLLVACLAFALVGGAQQKPADAPASNEDVERYFEVTHLRDTMKQMMDVMTKQMRQMVHEQVSKNAPNLPSDAEDRMNRMTEVLFKDFPLEEMLQAMIPVYQKHWTKGDVDAMVAFYSTPTGQKILRELPATMAEAMQAMKPIMEKQMKAMMERTQQELAQMIEAANAQSGQKSQAKPN